VAEVISSEKLPEELDFFQKRSGDLRGMGPHIAVE
jgi:hypothetical protein